LLSTSPLDTIDSVPPFLALDGAVVWADPDEVLLSLLLLPHPATRAATQATAMTTVTRVLLISAFLLGC
jgi:hypothetical protein